MRSRKPEPESRWLRRGVAIGVGAHGLGEPADEARGGEPIRHDYQGGQVNQGIPYD